MVSDLIALFRCFRENNVKYLVIGGVAAMVHGVNRTTLDLDIMIEATKENAERLLKSMEQAGFGTAALATADSILQNEMSIFEDIIRVDVQTNPPGLKFEDGWERRQTVVYQGMKFFVVSKADLINMKIASGREIDRFDVEQLERKTEET